MKKQGLNGSCNSQQAVIEVWHWTGIATPVVHWNQWVPVPAPVRFNWYFMSVLTFEAVSGRIVGRRCGWRSYVYTPRRPRKISPLHSLGHLITMEGRSTLRKQCTGISLFFEVQCHLAKSYNSYMAAIHKKSSSTA